MIYREKTYVTRLEMEFTNKRQRPLTDNERDFLSWLDKKRQVEVQIGKTYKDTSRA